MKELLDVKDRAVLAQAIWLAARNGIFIDGCDLCRTYGLAHVEMRCRGNVLTLMLVEVKTPGQGDGTRFMKALTEMADAQGLTLALTPDNTFGATSLARLKRFYRRFGFRDNRGRNADPSINQGMIRRPLELD